MKLVARRIANIMQFDKCFNESRFIFADYQYTPEDKAEIEENTERVLSILKEYDGKPWNDCLIALHKIAVPSFHIGFKEQDRIIRHCARKGIHFAR